MKQITINDIQLKEVNIVAVGNDYSVQAVYSLLDNNGNELQTKRATQNDFTATQKTKIGDILNVVKNYFKNLEGI